MVFALPCTFFFLIWLHQVLFVAHSLFGLPCSMWDFFQLWHVNSSVAACEKLFPHRGSNPGSAGS